MKKSEKKYYIQLIIFLSVLVGICLGLYLSPLGEHLSSKRAILIASQTPDNWVTFLVFILIFTLGSWVLFPLTLTSVLTIVVFPFWKACLCSLLGVAASATFSYFIGRYVLDVSKVPRFHKYVDFVQSEVDRLSFWAIGALRLAPQPPFIATSVIAGSLKLHFFQYLLASIIGLSPMIALGLLLGSRALKLLRDPSVITLTAMGAALILIPLFFIVKNKLMSEKKLIQSN